MIKDTHKRESCVMQSNRSFYLADSLQMKQANNKLCQARTPSQRKPSIDYIRLQWGTFKSALACVPLDGDEHGARAGAGEERGRTSTLTFQWKCERNFIVFPSLGEQLDKNCTFLQTR